MNCTFRVQIKFIILVEHDDDDGRQVSTYGTLIHEPPGGALNSPREYYYSLGCLNQNTRRSFMGPPADRSQWIVISGLAAHQKANRDPLLHKQGAGEDEENCPHRVVGSPATIRSPVTSTNSASFFVATPPAERRWFGFLLLVFNILFSFNSVISLSLTFFTVFVFVRSWGRRTFLISPPTVDCQSFIQHNTLVPLNLGQSFYTIHLNYTFSCERKTISQTTRRRNGRVLSLMTTHNSSFPACFATLVRA